MALPKEIYGVIPLFSALILAVYGVCGIGAKSRKHLRRNQKLPTFADLS